MKAKVHLSKAVLQDMKEKHIDIELTKEILNNYNSGKYDSVTPIIAEKIPEIDGDRIIDVREEIEWSINREEAEKNIQDLGLELDLVPYGKQKGDDILFRSQGLGQIGVQLFPLTSYGILNGGSATSYIDGKKNKSFSEELFRICSEEFNTMTELSKGKAKGITPAFTQPDGTPGPSFIELKMRSLLIQALEYKEKYGIQHTEKKKAPVYPFFQMTSVHNNDQIAETYRTYRESPLLKPLMRETGIDITQAETGVQPLIAAFTHSDEGETKFIFTRAHGKENSVLPLPGGHGQNFSVLKEIYLDLYRQGKRFVYLGNVDNLGNTVSPKALALLALSGKQAGFDFSFRTPVDVKGGILVVDQNGRLNCADIGPAISKEEVFKAESSGKGILFNCATGLFNLKYLTTHIDRIIEELPMRISDQNKDAGKYSQAEQVTWEVLGILDDFLVFGVDKYKRFLAAKLLLESLMTSGIGIEDPEYPTSENPAEDLRSTAEKLHHGLQETLTTVYGMKREKGKWIPKTAAELRTSWGRTSWE